MEITSRNPMNVPIDRLSFLPDDVICHILSSLPTKILVSTSILARRWRSLWVHVPDLDFSIDHMSYLTTKSYSDIISSVMSQRKAQTINTFRLRLSYAHGVRSYDFKAWITNAISCSVRCFDLNLRYQLAIPEQLFTCETLVSLRLDSCVIGSDAVSLPNLKKLLLYSITCEADKTIPCLLSGCPVLEELTISVVYDSSENLSFWNISSPTINRLTLNIHPHKVRVFAPALGYLMFYDRAYQNISLCHLSSLVEAHILLYSDLMEEVCANNPIYLFDFLNQIRNVQYLKLSNVNIVEFSDMGTIGSSYPVLKLYNLTNLDMHGDWRFLTKLLEWADNLQVLIIREFWWGWTDKDLKIWMEAVEQSPACLCSLRTVTFENFGCKEAEFKMVRYLMRNAKVLKRMKIRFYKGFVCAETKSDAMKRILSWEKGQEACELVLC